MYNITMGAARACKVPPRLATACCLGENATLSLLRRLTLLRSDRTIPATYEYFPNSSVVRTGSCRGCSFYLGVL